MNEHPLQGDGERGALSRSPVRQIDDATLHAAAKTILTAGIVRRSLQYLDSAIEGIVQAAGGSRDLTLPQWLILVHLSRTHESRQGEIYPETGITTGYLTRLLDGLDAKRMIRRHRSAKDRRQMLLSLTDQGEEAALSLLGSIDHCRLLNALDGLKASLDSFMSISLPENTA